jgi:DNA-binding transcriptional LysR family regulator
MEMSRLKAFMAVIETRNFARAADKLGVSQPGISKNIKALETDLGVTLFERGRFGAEPTAFANALVRRAKLILAEGRLAEAEIAAMRGAKQGRLSIGAGLGFLPKIMPKALNEFHRRWPKIAVHVESGLSNSLFESLLRGDIEFVVSSPTGPSDNAELDQVPLYDAAQTLVARYEHPLVIQPPSSFQDLLPFPWLASRGLGIWDSVTRKFLEAGVEPPVLFLDTSSEVLSAALLEEGDYICLRGRDLYAHEIDEMRLRAIVFEPFEQTVRAYLTSRRRSELSLPARNMARIIHRIASQQHTMIGGYNDN